MTKNIKTISFLLFLIILFSSNTNVFATNEPLLAPTPNITKYIPFPHNENDLEKAHTIHWAQGITPPTMPGQILDDGSIVDMKKSDFVMIDTFDNPTTPDINKTDFGYYVTDYKPGKGWYDIDKNFYYAPERPANDENACYAAAASNVISWWIDRNRQNIESYLDLLDNPSIELNTNPKLANPALLRQYLDSQENGFPSTDPKNSMVYDLLVKGFHSVGNYDGGYVHSAMDPFFNGYIPKVLAGPNTPDRFIPFKEGGFFYPVFGLSPLTYESWYVRYDVLNSSFKGYFDAGYGVAIGYRHLNGAHAVSVWGAEYDENDKLCGLFITDSNDAGELRLNYRDWNKKNHSGSMRRYDCYPDTNGITTIGSNKIISPNKGSFLYSVCILDTAYDEWEYFLKNYVPKYPNGDPLVTNDDYLKPLKEQNPASELELTFKDVPDEFPKSEFNFSVNVSGCNKIDDGFLLVAGYSKNGHLFEINIAPISKGKDSININTTFNNLSGDLNIIKAFLVNNEFAPVLENISLYSK